MGRVQFGMRSDPYQRTITHNDTRLTLTILRARRKTLAIHVLPSGIEVRAPLKCPWVDIDRFIESRLDWLISAREQVQQQPPPLGFLNGEYHQYLGSMYKLRVTEANSNAVTVADEILLGSKKPNHSTYNEQIFLRFLKREAEQTFASRLAVCLASFPIAVNPTGLRIRKMRARWGSCSETGEICLNSLLMQKDLRAIDLVINHELCHLRHFHHNKSFYQLMDRAMPEWRDIEPLLKPINSPGRTLMPEQQLMLF